MVLPECLVNEHAGIGLAQLLVNQELVHDANNTLNTLIRRQAKEARTLPDDNALGAV